MRCGASTVVMRRALVAFDLIERDGEDLRDLPLIERKRRLARPLGGTKHAIRFNEYCWLGLAGG